MASCMASEVARSVLAAETARMMALGFLVYCITSRTWLGVELGLGRVMVMS